MTDEFRPRAKNRRIVAYSLLVITMLVIGSSIIIVHQQLQDLARSKVDKEIAQAISEIKLQVSKEVSDVLIRFKVNEAQKSIPPISSGASSPHFIPSSIPTTLPSPIDLKPKIPDQPSSTGKVNDNENIFNLVARLSFVGLVLYITQALLKLYRYNMLKADHFLSCSDALRISEECSAETGEKFVMILSALNGKEITLSESESPGTPNLGLSGEKTKDVKSI